MVYLGVWSGDKEAISLPIPPAQLNLLAMKEKKGNIKERKRGGWRSAFICLCLSFCLSLSLWISFFLQCLLSPLIFLFSIFFSFVPSLIYFHSVVLFPSLLSDQYLLQEKWGFNQRDLIKVMEGLQPFSVLGGGLVSGPNMTVVCTNSMRGTTFRNGTNRVESKLGKDSSLCCWLISKVISKGPGQDWRAETDNICFTSKGHNNVI